MKIKICGMTHPEDALKAAALGADFIGIVFAKNSKRFVSSSQALEISLAAQEGGAAIVAVFVEQSAEEIKELCAASKIKRVQLHGMVSKKALRELLPHYEVIYAVSVNSLGVAEENPPHFHKGWLLYDAKTAGSGIPFNWEAFQKPSHPLWILAGGLNPENVKAAIEKLHPMGVDVSSGVEKKGTVRKDFLLMEKFIEQARLL